MGNTLPAINFVGMLGFDWFRVGMDEMPGCRTIRKVAGRRSCNWFSKAEPLLVKYLSVMRPAREGAQGGALTL